MSSPTAQPTEARVAAGTALFQAICNNPDDTGLRLIHADWLEEQGDLERAEFIRLQCQLAGLPEDDERRRELEIRECELLERHAAEWLGRQDLPGFPWEPVFQRGWVDEVHLVPARRRNFFSRETGAGLPSLEPLFQRHPVRILFIAFPRDEDISALPVTPWLDRLQALHLEGAYPVVGDSLLAALCASPHLESLRCLSLRDSGLGVQGALALAQSSLLGQLHELFLDAHHVEGFGPAVPELLAQAQGSSGLRKLGLRSPGQGAAGLTALTTGRAWPVLDTLFFQGSAADAGVCALARSDHLPALRRLNLTSSGITAIGARALAGGPLAFQLEELHLGHNLLGPEGAAELVSGQGWPALHALHLPDSGLTAAGVRKLAFSPALARLKVLNLAHNALGDEGVEALATSPYLTGLTHLNLSNTRMSPRGVRALASSPRSTSLTRLDLSMNPLGDEGLCVLAASSQLDRLRTLDFTGCESRDEGLYALAWSPHLPRLAILHVPGDTVAGFNALRDSPRIHQLEELNTGIGWGSLDPAMPPESRLRILQHEVHFGSPTCDSLRRPRFQLWGPES